MRYEAALVEASVGQDSIGVAKIGRQDWNRWRRTCPGPEVRLLLLLERTDLSDVLILGIVGGGEILILGIVGDLVGDAGRLEDGQDLQGELVPLELLHDHGSYRRLADRVRWLIDFS